MSRGDRRRYRHAIALAAVAAVALQGCHGSRPASVARARFAAAAVRSRAPASPPASVGTADAASPSPSSAGSADALGKRIFVDKCASCHDADGTKPLEKGLPLSARGLALPDVRKTVDGRLSSATPDERRAVADYIVGLMSGGAGLAAR